jgi:hypothetical protein
VIAGLARSSLYLCAIKNDPSVQCPCRSDCWKSVDARSGPPAWLLSILRIGRALAELRRAEVAGTLAVIALRRPLCHSLGIPAQTWLAFAWSSERANCQLGVAELCPDTTLRSAGPHASRRHQRVRVDRHGLSPRARAPRHMSGDPSLGQGGCRPSHRASGLSPPWWCAC